MNSNNPTQVAFTLSASDGHLWIANDADNVAVMIPGSPPVWHFYGYVEDAWGHRIKKS